MPRYTAVVMGAARFMTAGHEDEKKAKAENKREHDATMNLVQPSRNRGGEAGGG